MTEYDFYESKDYLNRNSVLNQFENEEINLNTIEE